MTAADDTHVPAGIASADAHARAQAERDRIDAERAAARPAPASITGRPGRAERAAAEAVRCPFCKAPAGQPCHGPHHKPRRQPHPSRTDAARNTQPTPAPGANP